MQPARGLEADAVVRLQWPQHQSLAEAPVFQHGFPGPSHDEDLSRARVEIPSCSAR
jgi:hypothetical protein